MNKRNLCCGIFLYVLGLLAMVSSLANGFDALNTGIFLCACVFVFLGTLFFKHLKD